MGVDSMESVAIFGLITGCYALIIVHMRETSKQNAKINDLVVGHMKETASQLGNMYTLVNNHLQQHSIHQDASKFVSSDVCEQVRKAHETFVLSLEKKFDEHRILLESIGDRLTRMEVKSSKS